MCNVSNFVYMQLVACAQEGEHVIRSFVCVVTTALFNLIPVADICEICVSVCHLLKKVFLVTAS
jgi:hypothetical protein